MFRTISLASLLFVCSAGLVAAQSTVTEVRLRVGMCDASAAVAIGTDRFIVGNDEDNFLRIYRRDSNSSEPEQGFDMNGFLLPDPAKPETDIEAAASIGNRIYWITSHGRNKDGEMRTSRYRFWATQWEMSGNRVIVYTVGNAYTRLLSDLVQHPSLSRYDLQSASQRAPKDAGALNIEGLAATPEGQLLIGFRNPIPGGKALIVPLTNPVDVTRGSRARLGEPVELDLAQRGIRDFAYSPALSQYLVVAGHYDTGLPSQLYLWGGKASDAPQLVSAVSFGGMNPEAVIVFSDQPRRAMVLSDDGTKLVGGEECKSAPNPRQRSYRSAWVSF